MALVPALLLLGLVAWQLAAAAHVWLAAGSAARAAGDEGSLPLEDLVARLRAEAEAE